MDDPYKQLSDFKYEANLLYAESVLQEQNIDFKSEDDNQLRLLVKPEVYTKALSIIESLQLDESIVSDECDGYIDGYIEWVDNQYVNGYFTGGRIPRWMFSKTYAQYYGPTILFSGLFYITTGFFQEDSLIGLLLFSPYVVCGYLLTRRGFKTIDPILA